MPIRTMQAIPLMIAGVWFIMYSSLKSQSLKKLVIVTAIILSVINAQYITRIVYGDNMRLQYDINYGNRIYNFILENAGVSIMSKPLIIVGHHFYTKRPFIIKVDSDTIGHSFFDWDDGNYHRIYYFMQWLGNDYILPTKSQNEDGLSLSHGMPSFPAKNSIKETESYIILKLSQ